MTASEVKTMLEGITGFSAKVTYWEWPENDAPALPFICYYSPGARSFGADNKVYYSSNRYFIELYTDDRDITTEEKVETQLNSYSVYWVKSIGYVESERMYQVTYEIEV